MTSYLSVCIIPEGSHPEARTVAPRVASFRFPLLPYAGHTTIGVCTGIPASQMFRRQIRRTGTKKLPARKNHIGLWNVNKTFAGRSIPIWVCFLQYFFTFVDIVYVRMKARMCIVSLFVHLFIIHLSFWIYCAVCLQHTQFSIARAIFNIFSLAVYEKFTICSV